MFEPKYKNYRVCYHNGIEIEGEEIYELHKYCNCSSCNIRQPRKVNEPVKEPRSICITTRDITKIDEIREFMESWTCEDSEQFLPRVYIDFDENKISKGGNSTKFNWR